MKKNICLAVVSAVILGLSACTSGAAPAQVSTVPADWAGRTNPLGAEAAAAGKEVFAVNCASCHGPNGRGDGPVSASLEPAPADLIALASQVGDDYLFWRISTGKMGTSMVPWSPILNDEQIWQAVAYIRSLE